MLNGYMFCPLINNKCKNHKCMWYVRDVQGDDKWDCAIVDIAKSLDFLNKEIRKNDKIEN